MFYYPYPTPNFSRKVYLQGPYPPWMAQPAYSYSQLSKMNYNQSWMPQLVVSDGGLSEFGLSGWNYGQRKWIQTDPMIGPTYYPAPMLNPYHQTMIQPAMSYGQLSTPYPPMFR